MRLVFTTFGFPAHTQPYIEGYVRALAERGVDVRVVASRPAEHPLPPSSASLRVLHAPVGDSRLRKLATMVRTLPSASAAHPEELRALVRSVRRRRGVTRMWSDVHVIAAVLAAPMDLLHVGWLTHAVGWRDLLSTVDVPVVVSCHGSDLRLEPLRSGDYVERMRAVFDRADLVHCVSHDLARHAVSFGLDESKLFVGAWGVDTTFFTPGSPVPTGDPLRVVSVGRLHWVKGYPYALQAMQLLRRAGVEVDYTILGRYDADQLLEVTTAVRDLGLEGSVHVRGLCTRDEVLDALRAADVFLLTSLSEGLSNAVLEAMAVGLPVVVSDVGGNTEIVDDGTSGLVVPAGDADATARALASLAGDPSLRSRLGAAARARVVSEFDVGVCAPRLLDEYRRVLAK